MSLLLALLALAGYFALPEDWRRVAGTPGDRWLGCVRSCRPASVMACGWR